MVRVLQLFIFISPRFQYFSSALYHEYVLFVVAAIKQGMRLSVELIENENEIHIKLMIFYDASEEHFVCWVGWREILYSSTIALESFIFIFILFFHKQISIIIQCRFSLCFCEKKILGKSYNLFEIYSPLWCDDDDDDVMLRVEWIKIGVVCMQKLYFQH